MDKKIIYLVKIYALKYNVDRMVIFTIFIAVLIITAVVWIIIYLIYNERRKGKPSSFL